MNMEHIQFIQRTSEETIASIIMIKMKLRSIQDFGTLYANFFEFSSSTLKHLFDQVENILDCFLGFLTNHFTS